MAIDRETLELRKREIDLYRQYENTWEYRKCRESGGQVSACFKLLVKSILRGIQLRLGNRYRKYADTKSGTVNFEQRNP
ncbi:MAG: hypothetical protein HQ557_00900 [Bacteroidetes bacterium]|nr:hypothetical protein [Bacteroidota bacterium]